MKRTLFFLLIAGALPVLSVRAQSKTEINRLKQRLRYSQPDSNRVRLLLRIADQYQNENSYYLPAYYDSAVVFSRQALTLSRSLGFRPLLGECLLAQSQALLFALKDSSKIKTRRLMTEALRLFKANADPVHWADAKLLFAKSYSELDSNQIPILQEALIAYRKVDDRHGINETLASYANVTKFMGQYQEALKLQLERLAIQKTIQDPGIDGTLGEIALLYLNIGNLPKSLDYAYQSFREAQKRNDPFRIAICNQRIGSIYSALGNHKSALDNYRASLKIYQSMQNPQVVVRVWLYISISLRALGRYQEALRAAKEALNLATTKEPNFKNNAMLGLAQTYVSLGDYGKAEAYYLRLLPKYPENTGGKAAISRGLGDVYFGKKQ